MESMDLIENQFFLDQDVSTKEDFVQPETEQKGKKFAIKMQNFYSNLFYFRFV